MNWLKHPEQAQLSNELEPRDRNEDELASPTFFNRHYQMHQVCARCTCHAI